MYTNRFAFRDGHAAVFFTALCCSTMAPASDVVVGYDFDDAAGAFEEAPDAVVSTLAALPWFDARGSLTNFAGNPGRALAAKTFLAGNALTLILNVAPGFTADLDGYSFDHMASSSGPSDWEFEINGAAVAAGTTSTSFVTETGALSMSGIAGTIVVDLAGFGATSNSGTYRLDNFVLTGEVTPVPIVPGIILLGSALAFVPLRSRR